MSNITEKQMENVKQLCLECPRILLERGMLKISDNGVPLCFELKRCPRFESLDKFMK